MFARSSRILSNNSTVLGRTVFTTITSKSHGLWNNVSMRTVASTTPSIFRDVILAPPDAILHTNTLFKACKAPNKVNLGVGAYRDNNGKSVVFRAVREAERRIAAANVDKEYIPIEGLASLATPAQKLIFGANDEAITNKRIVTTQSLSGTGALRIIGEFAKEVTPKSSVIVSEPTWGNHNAIFARAGFSVIKANYWDAAKKDFDFEGYLSVLKNTEEGAIIVLHACAHNPTGIDPTKEQWEEILDVIIEKKHVPLFDVAYQGFSSGSCDEDAHSIRRFRQKAPGRNLFVSQSFAKNMGMYGERIGCIHILCADQAEAARVFSRVALVIRAAYSSPPVGGARIVDMVLNTPELYDMWQSELKEVAGRIQKVRKEFMDKLEARLGCAPGTWGHINKQIGMFSYTGITPAQCEALINKHHVYLLKSSRISLAGLNDHNIDYVVNAFADVIENIRD